VPTKHLAELALTEWAFCRCEDIIVPRQQVRLSHVARTSTLAIAIKTKNQRSASNLEFAEAEVQNHVSFRESSFGSRMTDMRRSRLSVSYSLSRPANQWWGGKAAFEEKSETVATIIELRQTQRIGGRPWHKLNLRQDNKMRI